MDNEQFATRETAGNAPPLFAVVSRPESLPSPTEAEHEYFSKQLEALEYLNKARLARAMNPQSCLSAASVYQIRVLGEALRNKDFFYLALHQAYCLHSAAPNELSIVREPSLNIVPCLDILKQLFVDDQNFTSNLLTWFLEFPAPWAKMQVKKDFIDMMPQIQNSLDLISQNWTSFKQEINL